MKLFEIKTPSIDAIQKKLIMYKIRDYVIDETTGLVNAKDGVSFYEKRFTKLPVKFSKVNSHFLVHYCYNLKTLEGCPEIITGLFRIHSANFLGSLEHGPKEVRDFDFNHVNIKNLDHFPKVSGKIEIMYCPFLKSLVGLPDVTSNDLTLHGLDILNFDGMPRVVNGDLDISYIRKVKSLDGLPHTINGRLFMRELGDPGKMVKDGDFKTGFPYLALFKIKGLKEVRFTEDENELKQVEKIINKHIKTGDIIECQEELIEAGLKEYARLK